MDFKYPKICHLGDSETEGLFLDKVVATEKLDGANYSFHISDGRLIFRTRNHELSKEEENKEPWIRGVKFVWQKYNEAPQNFCADLVYYTELMIKHTLNYEWDRTPVLVGYDVLDKNTGRFFHYTKAKEEFSKIGIPFVKIIFEKEGQHIKIDELKELVEKEESAYGKEMEGVVCKNYSRVNRFDRPLFGKIVKSSFKERNRLAFTGLKELRDNERNIVLEYATPRRIEKSIQKLTLEGKELSMKLMPDLFKFVADDILTEEILNIADRYGSMHFKEFRNMVAAECAKELKRKLLESAK